MKQLYKKYILSHLPFMICSILLCILIALPTGYEDAVIYQGTDRCKAEVLRTDESAVVHSGLIRSGEQYCIVRLQGGIFKGQETEAYNMLSGSLENDKIYTVGDFAMVVVSHQNGEILSVNMIDHYRMDKEFLLMFFFAVVLVIFAGKTGLKSLLSFAIAVLSIWKILVPACLNGVNPILAGFCIVIALTVVIISLVYGYDRRFLAASSGAVLGTMMTCILGIIFTDLFKIHGAVMTNSESLLYAGFENLNLTQIFMASVFIGASGAIMDIAVDITSAVNEVVEKKPEISAKEAVLSGIHVGRAAMGTMTTTLLLAYSGGYLTLLMVFMAQGTPIYNILNYKYVASEILHTIVGSFGLVAVAPFTSLMSGFLLTRKNGLKL
ncbi:MAG: YibE/F family protein [Lachnospiraceae bacterium]|nr:YibE/F family protein [Lachnospiraceae bacterium]